MQRVINGKSYNTRTAKDVYCSENCDDYSNIKYYGQTLYRSPKGQYFIVTEGWKPTGTGNTDFTSQMHLVTRKEALEWAESNCPGGVVVDEFGDMIDEG